jgi:cytoskeletal protein CcmA (bactofilin family)
MKRNPLYVFDDLQSRGIDRVPVDSTIQINDVDQQGTPRIIQLVSKTGLGPDTTIAQFLAMPDTYVDLNAITEIPSELERITEDGKQGWRLLGRESDDYGNIGQEAVDLSKAHNITDPYAKYGATGDYSLAEGYRTRAEGWASHAEGFGTITTVRAGHAMGLYNKGQDQNNILEVGCGLGIGARENALEISNTGHVLAPNLSMDKILEKGEYSLVTKEYSDSNLDGKVNKSGDTITGNLYIIGENPNIEVSFTNGGLALFKNPVTLEKTLKIGLNDAFNSEIIFTDNNANLNPSIYWSDTYKDFFIKNSIRPDNRLWHSGNDGATSELSAGYVGPFKWDDMATKDYTNNGLDSKFDKIGGQISGDVAITGDLNVSDRTQTKDLRVNENSLFGGLSTFQDTLSANGNLISNIRFYVNDIYSIDASAIKVMSDIEFNSSIFRDKATFNDGLLVNSFPNGESIIEFQNINTGIPTEIFWSATDTSFMVKDELGTTHKLYHEGSPPPSVSDFDGLGDTPSNKTGAANKFLRVSSTETSIIYEDFDITEFIDDNAGNGILNKIWSADKLYDEFLEKLNVSGGQINGNLTVTGNLNASNLTSSAVTFSGDVTVNGDLDASSITSSTVDFTGDVTVNGDLDASNITSSTVGFSGDVAIDGDLTVNSTLYVQSNPNEFNNSIIRFEETQNPSSIHPAFYWDNTYHDFRIDDQTATGSSIWHTGNFDPATKYNVSGGTIEGDVVIQSNNNPAVYGAGNLEIKDLTSDNTGGNFTVEGDKIMMPNLPTTDPNNQGQLWNDGGILKISL